MVDQALVIGGGPAGASAALGLLKSGFDVTLFEQKTRWTGRVCGGFLNAEALDHLRWLGVAEEVHRAGAVPVRAAHLTASSNGRASRETTIRLRPGLGLSRQKLEEILLEAVSRLGGSVKTGARVTTVERGLSWTLRARSQGQEKEYSAPVLIFADGRFTSGTTGERPRREGWYGWNAMFQGIRQAPGDLSLHFYPGGYIGTLTLAEGKTNVCGLEFRTSDQPVNWERVFEQALDRQPAFKALARAATRVSEWRGVGPLPYSNARRESKSCFLAGDAAAVGDPFAGEGIGRALGAGPNLFEAFRTFGNGKHAFADALSQYNALWQDSYGPRLKVGMWARRALNRPCVFDMVFNVLFREPWLISHFLPRFHKGLSAKFCKSIDVST